MEPLIPQVSELLRLSVASRRRRRRLKLELSPSLPPKPLSHFPSFPARAAWWSCSVDPSSLAVCGSFHLLALLASQPLF